MNPLKSSSINQYLTKHHPIQTRQCNVKLNVEYEQNELEFKWDLTDVPISSSYFTRHIVIFDLDNSKKQISEQKIIKIFYKYMKLGDFIRVFNTKGQISAGWIQKTSQELKSKQFQLLKKQKKSLIHLLQRCLKKKKELMEPLAISIFSNQTLMFTPESIQQISKIKQKYKFNFIFNVFFLLENQNHNILPQSHKTINLYQWTNLQDIQIPINDFFYYLNKIRVQSASLKLICLTKNIQLCDMANSQWQIQQDCMVRNLYMLNNYTKYVQKIYINSLQNQIICFEIEFDLNFIENTKYKMTKKFYVNVQNNCNNLNKIPQNSYRKTINPKLFSQMIKGNGIANRVNSQRIILRQKYPEFHLQYQKQMQTPQ